MLSIKDISQFYPPELRQFQRNILREYLQYKILEIVFNAPQGRKLSFIGGTALRMFYGAGRFSEDLDFDNFRLTESEFWGLIRSIEKKLRLEGYVVSVEVTTRGALHCRIKFLDLLQREGLSGHANEKILVQLDTTLHNFDYNPDIKTLNKFDVFTQIRVAPPDILLAQKICAAFNRARAMGRDFYDIVFLLSLTKPNYQYLQAKIGVSTAAALRAYLISHSRPFNFSQLAKDIEPFLIRPEEKKRVELFAQYVKEAKLD